MGAARGGRSVALGAAAFLPKKRGALNVFQLIAIYNVCFGDGLEVKTSTIDELVSEGIILRSKRGKLSMSKEYRKLVAEISHRGDVNGDVNGYVNGDINGETNGETNGEINNLKGSQREVYLIVLHHPGIKIKQVAELRKKSVSTVWKQLTDLRKKDIIEYRGANKTGGYYVK